ncbi:TOBE domain-containing protein [Lichenihabitans psoromatis]|uniref:TOBE domain-containing protein n=1 Tax=Lichenihabitans psoromatis TaxID=2528642 RepID=UPI001036CAA7|nr:TOBE domain-containing protein [Lichenihabitans psoromatis]
MKLSARNQLSGTVLSVVRGSDYVSCGDRNTGGQRITSSITNEAVDDLKLETGKSAIVVIKASDVSVTSD